MLEQTKEGGTEETSTMEQSHGKDGTNGSTANLNTAGVPEQTKASGMEQTAAPTALTTSSETTSIMEQSHGTDGTNGSTANLNPAGAPLSNPPPPPLESANGTGLPPVGLGTASLHHYPGSDAGAPLSNPPPPPLEGANGTELPSKNWR